MLGVVQKLPGQDEVGRWSKNASFCHTGQSKGRYRTSAVSFQSLFLDKIVIKRHLCAVVASKLNATN